jgi:transposase
MGGRPLIDGVSFETMLADNAFNPNWLRLDLDARGTLPIIPPRKNRKQPIQIDAEMYKWRHLVENYFAKIKEFRGIATRYDKTADSFRANINLTVTHIACS